MNPRDLSTRRSVGNVSVSLEQLCCLIGDKDVSYEIYSEDDELIGVYKEAINPVLLDHRVVRFSFGTGVIGVIYITISREVVY